MIDRYLLRYFLAVIDCGSFSKAAKQLNVAQPSLSVGIGKLERLLGAPLFQRTSKRVHITDAGSRFASHARRIENEFNLAEAAVATNKEGHVKKAGLLFLMFAAIGILVAGCGEKSPTTVRVGVIARTDGRHARRWRILQEGAQTRSKTDQ